MARVRVGFSTPLTTRWSWGSSTQPPTPFPTVVEHAARDSAVAHGLAMWSQGADIIDVGGESTRPGAEPVSADQESSRVVPVVRDLASQGVLVSVDTMKASVAAAAIEAGAHIINDVTALGDPAMAGVCAEAGVGLVLMHMQGSPQTMQDHPRYEDVVSEVADFLEARAEYAVAAGVDRSRLCIDPGIGFGKSFDHNLDLLGNIGRFARLRPAGAYWCIPQGLPWRDPGRCRLRHVRRRAGCGHSGYGCARDQWWRFGSPGTQCWPWPTGGEDR